LDAVIEVEAHPLTIGDQCEEQVEEGLAVYADRGIMRSAGPGITDRVRLRPGPGGGLAA
jgi:hypothetical protein